MRKIKLIAILLLLCTLLNLSGCVKKIETGSKSEDTTESTPEDTTVSKPEGMALINGGSEIIIDVQKNIPYIVYLATTESEVNIVDDESQMFLPTSYMLDDASAEFVWTCTNKENTKNSIVLTFEDSAVNVQYIITVIANTDLDGPFQISGQFINNSSKDLTYATTEMFHLNMVFDAVPVAWSFSKESGQAEGTTLYNGSYYEGTGIYKTSLESGERTRIFTNSENGWNNNGYIPIIYLDNNSMSGAYIALEWPDGTIETKGGDESGSVSATVCITENFKFKTAVKAGESLGIPVVYLGVYDGDVDEGSNVFKHWFFNIKSPAVLRGSVDEPLTQMDMQAGLEVADWGIQSVKWDYGWWSDKYSREQTDATLTWNWKTLEGSWIVRDSGYLAEMAAYDCNELASFTALAKERGLTVATYLLLHDSAVDVDYGLTSVGENGHSDWFSTTAITTGRSADLGNADCVEYLKTTLADFFSINGVTTWRSDFEPICSDSDKINRHFSHGSDVAYWCATGFYDIVDYLYANVEDFRYECCSSGGSMKDFATMTRAVVINNDDSADYTSLRTSFYDSSYCIPSAQLQLPCNLDTFDSSSIYYTGTGDVDFGMRSIILGGIMLSSWSGENVNEEIYTKYCNMYNEKIKPLVRTADLYHLLPRPDGTNWDGIQYVDKDSENEIKGCVFLFKPTDSEGDTKNIVLRGLDENAMYTLEFEDRAEQNVTMSGADLMTTGIDVTISEDMGSDILWIKS